MFVLRLIEADAKALGLGEQFRSMAVDREGSWLGLEPQVSIWHLLLTLTLSPNKGMTCKCFGNISSSCT